MILCTKCSDVVFSSPFPQKRLKKSNIVKSSVVTGVFTHLEAALEKLLEPGAGDNITKALSEEAVSRWASAQLHPICSVNRADDHLGDESWCAGTADTMPGADVPPHRCLKAGLRVSLKPGVRSLGKCLETSLNLPLENG